jgi:hypothetical protein
MNKNINNLPITIIEQCFFCKQNFELFDIQKTPINICGLCITQTDATSLTRLTTIGKILVNISEFSKNNIHKINEKDAIFLDEFIEYLQK